MASLGAPTIPIRAMQARTSQTDTMQQSVGQIAEFVMKDGSGELPQVVRRKMGDTELSYYLSSRENGVNDM
jgi:hypothetical protein